MSNIIRINCDENPPEVESVPPGYRDRDTIGNILTRFPGYCIFVPIPHTNENVIVDREDIGNVHQLSVAFRIEDQSIFIY